MGYSDVFPKWVSCSDAFPKRAIYSDIFPKQVSNSDVTIVVVHNTSLGKGVFAVVDSGKPIERSFIAVFDEKYPSR